MSAIQIGQMLRAFNTATREVEQLRGQGSTGSQESMPAAALPTSVTHVVQLAQEDPLSLPFSRVLSPTAPGTFLPLTSAELTEARQTHCDVLGNHPKEDA